MTLSILTFFSIFILIFGILFLVSPNLVQKMNDIGNIIVITVEKTIVHRYITGALLLIISIILVFSAFRL